MTEQPTTPPVRRAKGGRFVSVRCPDPNCCGALNILEDGWWRCDGLTHAGDSDELVACRRVVEA